MRIKDAEINEYDLVSCSEKRRACIASVGIEGQVIQFRSQYLSQGFAGFKAYLMALLKSYFGGYKPTTAKVVIDKAVFEVENLLSFIVVKQPYYGFGMKVVPRACFDDGYLHILCITSGVLKSIFWMATSFTIGNRVGHYLKAQHATVFSERVVALQIDGNEGWEANTFTFKVLPNALKIKC
ncbi:diacylglycerol/lipid kinase family protein [Thermodesulfobacteriota bacterium]